MNPNHPSSPFPEGRPKRANASAETDEAFTVNRKAAKLVKAEVNRRKVEATRVWDADHATAVYGADEGDQRREHRKKNLGGTHEAPMGRMKNKYENLTFNVPASIEKQSDSLDQGLPIPGPRAMKLTGLFELNERPSFGAGGKEVASQLVQVIDAKSSGTDKNGKEVRGTKWVGMSELMTYDVDVQDPSLEIPEVAAVEEAQIEQQQYPIYPSPEVQEYARQQDELVEWRTREMGGIAVKLS